MLKDNRPRHEQISEWIRNQIQSGVYHEDDQLPSENDLADKFSVSRVTVRHALKTLENEGLIYRRQGLGSFVDDTTIDQPMVCLTDFTEDMNRAGLEARSQVVSKKILEAGDTLTAKLKVDSDARILQLDRIRLGNNTRIAFDRTWLPMFYGQLLEGHNLEVETIYAILEKQYEIPILKGKYHITAANAAPYLAEQLKVEPQSALILIERTSLSTGDKIIYYQRRYYRPDRIHYEVELERRDKNDCDYKKGLPLKKFVPVFFE